MAVYVVISAGFQCYLLCQVLLNNLVQSNEQMLYSHCVLRLDSFVCVHNAHGSVHLCVVQRGRKRREL